MTMRRYFVTVTPGIATGYWNAMNSPARARSSGSASVMSLPSRRISPSVTSKFGWPISAFASVDLPEPFGPISAWNSPERTCRSTPLRICLSPAETCRFLISRSAMVSEVFVGLGLAGGEGHELRQGGALQRLDDAHLHARPQQLGGAQLAVVVMRAQHASVAVVEEAVHRGDVPLERQDDLVHRDLLLRAGEEVAAVGSPRRLDDARPLEQGGDALEVGERQGLGLGDRLERDGPLPTVEAQLHEQPDAVLRLGGEDHRWRKPTNAVGVPLSSGLRPPPDSLPRLMNGAESLVSTAADAGVDICFANPGTTEMDLVRALDGQDRIRSVLGLFEGVCTAAADGYARMAERPALVLLHLG